MSRRLLLAVLMLTAGACLIAAGNSFAFKQGGVFLVASTGSSVPVDPQIAWVTTAWWLEYATAAKLYNYPDKPEYAGALLRPEVASGYTVSNNGKTYTFTIRKGFRFSDGEPVTAKSFKYAVDRALNKDLSSPAAWFINDPNGTKIVGAGCDPHGGMCSHGAIAKGDKFIVKLVRPDATFMSKITLPFFQATSTRLKLNKETIDVRSAKDLPTAGPYSYTRKDDQITSIRRNPYWKPGPGRRRPRNLDGVDITWNVDENTGYLQTLDNDYDLGPLPAVSIPGVAKRFGVNRTRFWVEPIPCTGFVAFNNLRGLFAGNPQLRKAVSWALNRTDYVHQSGLYAGSPWTHFLPPGTPGSLAKQLYGVRPDLAKAKALAAGHFGAGRVVVAYFGAGNNSPNQALVVRRDLIRLGFDPDHVVVRNYYDELGDPFFDPHADWDLWASGGWCADYPDPMAFFGLLLKPNPFHLAVKYRKKIAAANKLVGDERMKAFGELDLEMMRNLAPIAPMRTYNNRYFFSNRVDPRSLVYQGVYSDWSIPALALK